MHLRCHAYSLAVTPTFSKSNENFTTLDQRQGLGQPGILSMTQDNLGYIWVGTQAGLNRYDGYKFLQFSDSKPALSVLAGTYISALCNTKNNILWIGTRSGISRYNYQTGDTSILSEENGKIPSNKISSLSCGDNRVVVGTFNNGTFALETTTGEMIADSITTPISIAHVYQFNNVTYIAGRDGFYRQWHSTNTLEKLTTDKVTSITANNEWIFLELSLIQL